ncbi:hypothetical protein C5167_007642 [Papaver somniferum]|uniref:zinc finger protein 10-like n=1 Tax=Papaver somniferum TaxID=3469 RepID=UPI000E6FB343|nr:zinc finger protein 10-like [Papaver somniferum]RZC93605.1 hypothetical protein C5167_007642 [Papaver somniferum]
METGSGTIMEDAAKYWMWMNSKPVGDVRSSSNNVIVGEANNWEERAFAVDSAGPLGGFVWPPRSYTCSFCAREFRSAQALGGHMNVHRRDRARLKESDHPPIYHYSPNNNNIHRAVDYNSDGSIVSLLPLSSTQEIRDVNGAAGKTILLVSPSFAWSPTVVHENNYEQIKEVAGSTLFSQNLSQTADPVLVRVPSSSGSCSSSAVICQSAVKLDRDKSSSKANDIDILEDELAKEDSTAAAGSGVSLSCNIDSNRRPTCSINIHRHVSSTSNKRRRRDIQPPSSLSQLMPAGGTAGSTSSAFDKTNGLLHSYNSSMDELDLELRL